MVENKAEGRALRQIREKGYTAKYRALDRPIHSTGVEFRKKRGMWGVEAGMP
ncbi:MAG: PD-(D/E)XK nuclease domain-containing protein [Azoarcus sp.]|jgi:hypothetical protein|nr:PD-(D/E)XK nuclease domain-containing protein [Azoarcus sp.]